MYVCVAVSEKVLSSRVFAGVLLRGGGRAHDDGRRGATHTHPRLDAKIMPAALALGSLPGANKGPCLRKRSGQARLPGGQLKACDIKAAGEDPQ